MSSNSGGVTKSGFGLSAFFGSRVALLLGMIVPDRFRFEVKLAEGAVRKSMWGVSEACWAQPDSRTVTSRVIQ